ncbi:PAS domain S-box-containing protein [Mucilaginibacter pineti]|uniref:histidine kinase n=1 Tax=Mucilaginibacter pineti TaxID=1391627 RepID=A0A1G7H721_9SPHI|nr:PAS domain-containing sensor histidine kinase [Mucilaginibacter pineti]SDE96064.1 PAS domain S-box-containing protein [Mucilaginibacter pineti]
MENSGSFGNLRMKAEEVLQKLGEAGSNVNEKDMQVLFQELQVHQIELEMQNDELSTANQELELQQLKFASVYDLAPVGYFILTQAGLINEVNNAGTSLMQAGKATLMSKPLRMFVAQEYIDHFNTFYHALRYGGRHTCQLKLISTSGREFYAQIEGIFTSEQSPALRQYYIAVIDITERIQAEKNLAEVKERLELSLEASSAGTWELELETMRFYLDEFNYNICAVPGGKFDGKYQTFINLIHPEDREMADEHFRTSINQEKEIDVVCRMVNTEGKICYAGIRGHVIALPGQQKRLVGIMMDITEKRRFEDETIRLKQNQQKNIALATLNAGENERKRISDSLHDSVSQLLYGVKIKLGLLNSDKDNIKAVLEISELLDLAIRETRNISFELAPSILTDFGLPATVEELVKRLSAKNMEIRAKISGFNERLDPLMEISIFRIIQELINNCMKHSGATLVKLTIKKNKNIDIEVKDNGKGFNVAEQEQLPGGSGLSSIKNRMNLYNGQMKIISEPGNGTTVNISLQHSF